MNKELRRKIAEIVYRGKDGHIPSAFSIVDIIDTLYSNVLRYDAKNPKWTERDYFVLSKGHGCVGFYAVLQKFGFIQEHDLVTFCRPEGILGEHPDCNHVPGVEASTGSLGHGFPFAVGIALGLQIRKAPNRVFTLVGDGECHEGTIWEAANIANNRELGNLCVVVDWNGSAAQLMPKDNLRAKWEAFGWRTIEVDGHDQSALADTFQSVPMQLRGSPTVILARTTKGKGVSFLEGHGQWHHRIPNENEFNQILKELQ